MKLLAFLAALPAALSLSPPQKTPEYLFSNPAGQHAEGYRIPTSYESAVMGRRILALTPLGDLSTVFPAAARQDTPVDAAERRPPGMEGQPIGLMDYIAECEDSGNPTLLAIRIATAFRNAAAGSNVSLSLRWAPPYPPVKRISVLSHALSFLRSKLLGYDGDKTPETVPYSAANLPRMSLQGYLEDIPSDETDHEVLKKCYVEKHPDSKYWLPGNPIHKSGWARLVVEQVYWIGGFGDRAYIGWIPIDEWRKVTKEEWMGIRLQGEEEGWEEWRATNEL